MFIDFSFNEQLLERMDNWVNSCIDKLNDVSMYVKYSSDEDKYDVTDCILMMASLNVDKDYKQKILDEVVRGCKTKSDWLAFEKRVNEEEKRYKLTDEQIETIMKRYKMESRKDVVRLDKIISDKVLRVYKELRILYKAAESIGNIKKRLILETIVQLNYCDVNESIVAGPTAPRIVGFVVRTWFYSNILSDKEILQCMDKFEIFTESLGELIKIAATQVEDKETYLKNRIAHREDNSTDICKILNTFIIRTLIRKIPIQISIYFSMLESVKLNVELAIISSGRDIDTNKDVVTRITAMKDKAYKFIENSCEDMAVLFKKLGVQDEVNKWVKHNLIAQFRLYYTFLSWSSYRINDTYNYIRDVFYLFLFALDGSDALNRSDEDTRQYIDTICGVNENGFKLVGDVENTGIISGLKNKKVRKTLSNKLEKAYEEIANLQERIDTYEENMNEAVQKASDYEEVLRLAEKRGEKIEELNSIIFEHERAISRYKKLEDGLQHQIRRLSHDLHIKTKENEKLRNNEAENCDTRDKKSLLNCYINALNKYRIALVGGDKMYTKLNEYGLNIKTFRAGAHNFGHQELANMDLIVLATKETDHCMHNIVKNEKDRYGTNVMYYNGKYVDSLIIDMFTTLYS